jgi:DEAD/DEAH box helicase domain-containing protein
MIVAKFKKIKFETHENVGYGEIHLPPQEMQTEGYWITFKEDLREKFGLSGEDLGGALQGLSSVLQNVVPLFVMCDPKDFYSMAMLRSAYDQRPAIYIYDRYPGGIGISRRIFSIDVEIFRAALEIVKTCECLQGCPSCVGPSMEVGKEGKAITKKILEQILAEK